MKLTFVPPSISSLVDQAAQRLSIYHQSRSGQRLWAKNYSILFRALIEKMEEYSTQGTPISREAFEELLIGWISSIIEENQSIMDVGNKKLLKQRIVKSFEEGDYRSFYASIFDLGFDKLTRILQWIVIESHEAYTDNVNIVELNLENSYREPEGSNANFIRGSEKYTIQFSPKNCQVSFDVRQFSWFNKDGKIILTDGWDSQYNGSLMLMYFDGTTQTYGWHSIERPDIEDCSGKARESILTYLKAKLNLI